MARASELDHNQVYSTRSEGELRVCAASLSFFLSFSLWSPATVIVGARGLSDDLEISLLSERGGVFGYVCDLVNSCGTTDRALVNRRVFGCGQGCFSSVLISFFFVSKAACSSAIFLCRCIVFHSFGSSQLQTVGFSFVTQSCTFATLGLA